MKKVLFVCLAIALMISPAVMLAAPVAANGAVQVVDIDIKPGSDPNSINVKSKGVLPVAILGTAAFDVTQIDPVSVALGWDGDIHRVRDVPPLRWALEDVNGDGFTDFGLKFSMEELMTYTMTREPPGGLSMMLEFNLTDEFGGTHIESYDTVRIINKGYASP